ncbi:MAG: hypothetical protein RLZZ476_653 [Verrucomicrobiota bacterium]|jgi:hypothetical protein
MLAGMKARPTIWIALLLTICVAAWRLELFAQPLELGNGARYVPRRVGGVMLHLVFFDESKTMLRVLSNPGRDSNKQLDQWGREQKALAVCNGGYFELGKLNWGNASPQVWKSRMECAAANFAMRASMAAV